MLRELSVEQLRKLPENEHKVYVCGKTTASLTTHRVDLEDGQLMIVGQIFILTLMWPNYISFAGVGRLYTEGFLVDGNGKVADAPDNSLWPYR